MIISGVVNKVPVLLVNVYAPNFDNPTFLSNSFGILPSLDQVSLFFGGDMNCTINSQLDRSKLNLSQSRMAAVLRNFMNTNGYVDPWRFRNPIGRQYSFYSNVHQSFSRIDYFF